MGIVIALALVSGSWIAVDSSGLGVLRATLLNYPVDFVASPTYSSALTDFSEASTGKTVGSIESVKDVSGATPYVSSYSGSVMDAAKNRTYIDPFSGSSGTVVFLSANISRFFDAFGIQGGLPDRGTVAISGTMADVLGVAVGDSILISYSSDHGYYDTNYTWISNITYNNYTFPVSKIWTQDPAIESSGYFDYYHKEKPEGYVRLRDAQNPVVLNLADLGLMFNASTVMDIGYPSLSYYIWVDRAHVINLGDLTATLDKLQFIQRQLNKKGYSDGYTVSSTELEYPLTSLAPSLEGLKFLFLALSAPVIGLGTYLSVVGVDLGVTERRREAGILKSRGASYRQVLLSLLIEAVALGAIAGVAGLLIGFGLSRPLMDVATSFSAQAGHQSLWTDLAVSPATVIVSIILGILLMLLSSYRSFKRVSKSEIAEALHYYSPTASQLEYRARNDIIFIALSAWSIASILLGLNFVNRVHMSWIVQIVLALMVLVGIAIFPVMPFMLSLGVVRLLTRGSRKLYSKFTVLVKPWTKELNYLVDRNIVRNPKRASNLCVIISLALAFGLFISVTMESSMAFERDKIVYGIGSDVRVDSVMYGPVYRDSAPNYSKLGSLGAISGVTHVAFFRTGYVNVDLMYMYQGAQVYLLNHTDYAQTVRPSDFFFVGGGSEMLDDLAVNGSALLDVSWHDNQDVLEGDVITLHISWSSITDGNWTYNNVAARILVAGFVKTLPGFPGSNGIYLDRSSLSFLGDENLTDAYFGLGAFMSVSKGADQTLIGQEAVGIFSSAGLSATYRSVDEELTNLKTDPTYGALSAFLYVEYILSGAIMTLGVGLLIFVAVADREKELASIMARGSSGSQIRKILMGESITLMIIGLLVGASVGLLTAGVFNTLYTQGAYGIVQRRMVFTAVSGGIVIASVLALLAASFVATASAGRIKLAEVLRIRGG